MPIVPRTHDFNRVKSTHHEYTITDGFMKLHTFYTANVYRLPMRREGNGVMRLRDSRDSKDIPPSIPYLTVSKETLTGSGKLQASCHHRYGFWNPVAPSPRTSSENWPLVAKVPSNGPHSRQCCLALPLPSIPVSIRYFVFVVNLLNLSLFSFSLAGCCTG